MERAENIRARCRGVRRLEGPLTIRGTSMPQLNFQERKMCCLLFNERSFMRRELEKRNGEGTAFSAFRLVGIRTPRDLSTCRHELILWNVDSAECSASLRLFIRRLAEWHLSPSACKGFIKIAKRVYDMADMDRTLLKRCLCTEPIGQCSNIERAQRRSLLSTRLLLNFQQVPSDVSGSPFGLPELL